MDVERFSELLQQVEAGEMPEGSGEASDLLALASGLMDSAPSVALPEDAEARIFAKMQAMEPSLQHVEAYDLDPALSMLASRLEGLAVASEEMEMDELAEQRIFRKIEAGVPEIARKRRLAAFKDVAAAITPAALIRRKADALEDLLVGCSSSSSGELGRLVAAASALSPVPAIEPSPSFVDWLEVRLASPSAAPEPARRKIAAFDSLKTAFSSGRFQTGLAGAAAMLAIVAGLSLQDSQDVSKAVRRNQGPVPAVSAAAQPPAGDQPSDVELATQGADSATAVAASTINGQTANKNGSSGVTGTGGTNGSPGDSGGTGGGDEGGGTGPTDTSVAASTGATAVAKTIDTVTGVR